MSRKLVTRIEIADKKLTAWVGEEKILLLEEAGELWPLLQQKVLLPRVEYCFSMEPDPQAAITVLRNNVIPTYLATRLERVIVNSVDSFLFLSISDQAVDLKTVAENPAEGEYDSIILPITAPLLNGLAAAASQHPPLGDARVPITPPHAEALKSYHEGIKDLLIWAIQKQVQLGNEHLGMASVLTDLSKFIADQPARAENPLKCARERLEAAAQIEPLFAEAHYALGVVALEEGWLDDARARFTRSGQTPQRIVRKEGMPVYNKALLALGELMLRQKLGEQEAERCLRKSITDAENHFYGNFYALMALGRLFRSQGRHEQAVLCLTQALENYDSRVEAFPRINLAQPAVR